MRTAPTPTRDAWRRKAAAIVGAVALTVSGLASTAGLLPTSASPAIAAPGTPGIPQPPVVVYDEDFDNRPGPTPVARLTEYVGATGQTYTADPSWLTGCNGWIAAANQPTNAAAPVADCVNQINWNRAQQLAGVLGTYGGDANAAANFAVSAYTAGNPGANFVEFATASNINLPAATGRYLAFSVDVAAINCPPVAAAPLLNFSLIDGGGAANPVGGTINPCASGTTIQAPALGVATALPANVGTYTSNGSVLLDGASFGIQMTNATATGGGNDHAFDNIRVLDATPQLDKSFSDTSIVRGETTTLTFTVTNTSELASKEGWSFTDVLPTGMTVAGAATTTCPAGVVDAPLGGSEIAVSGNLNVGQASCTITVDVTTDSTGTFTNGPDNVTETGLTPPGETTIIVNEQEPELTLVKSSDASTGEIVAGQVVTYSFLVTNTGNIRVDDVTITDLDFTGSGELGAITCPAEAASLAVDASITCTAQYTVTQADVDAGQIDNTAVAGGTPPAGEPVTSNESSTTVPAPPAPALAIEKSADTEGPLDVGDEIVYSFVVTNTGNVTVDAIAVDDGLLTASGITVTCDATTLAPQESTDCVADGAYTVIEADLLAGDVTNTATASGTDPDGGSVESPEDSVIVPTVDPAPALSIVKSATPNEGTFAPGETVEYRFVVTNTGNVTMSDIAIDETEFSGTGELSEIVCDVTTLAPTEQAICTTDYTLTQADVDAESLTNAATVTGTPPPGGGTFTPPPPSLVEIPTPDAPAITIVKSADVETIVAAGDVVTYSFLVTNTGNVTLDDVTVVEGEFSGSGELSAIDCPTTTLVAGQSTTCTATYTVTQADVDAADELTNVANAEGTTPGGGTVPGIPSTSTVVIERTPELSIVKTSDVEAAAVGQVVTYSFLVTNTGNVTITDPVVEETEFTGTGELSAIDCPAEAAVLEPSEAVTCTATYTMTQADVDAGEVDNSATVGGTPPTGTTLTPPPPSTVTIVTDPTPAMTLVKTADVTEITRVGQVVTYSFLVTNTGNVTITDPVVTEGEFSGAGELSAIDCPAEAAVLDPAEAVTCTATYTVVAADLASDELTNTATASGTTPFGPIETTPSTSTITVNTPSAPPAAGGNLPRTGGMDAAPFGVLAALLLALGGILIVRRRMLREDTSGSLNRSTNDGRSLTGPAIAVPPRRRHRCHAADWLPCSSNCRAHLPPCAERLSDPM